MNNNNNKEDKSEEGKGHITVVILKQILSETYDEKLAIIKDLYEENERLKQKTTV